MTGSKPKLKDLTDSDKIKLLEDVFSDEKGFQYAEFVRQVKLSFSKLFNGSVGDNQAKDFIKECSFKDWIHQEKPKEKYTLSSSLEPP